jgi:hypothetical protein
MEALIECTYKNRVLGGHHCRQCSLDTEKKCCRSKKRIMEEFNLRFQAKAVV